VTDQPAPPDVICTVNGRAGLITLNRPQAINSLTMPMLVDIAAALDRWVTDPDVEFVVLAGAGSRGLCAGGDVRAMWHSARSRDGLAQDFFRAEYRLNAQVARFPKPFVALMDGIVMGGGVGLASHSDVRVVTDRSKVAMPEVTIGLVPDVGATYLLSRAPGEAGTHLALTGAAVGAGDALWLGLADHFVPYDRLDQLRSALLMSGPAEALTSLAEPPPESALAGYAWLDACYAWNTVEEIVDALRGSGDPEADAAADVISTKSPTALKVTLESLRRARRLASLEEALEQEFRVSCACLDTADLVEGIRAQVIDKDRSPGWSPALLADVSGDVVEAFFDDRGIGGLGLVRRGAGQGD
jgi:enoyl-CoA hydratase